MSKTPIQYLEAYQKLHDATEGFLVEGKVRPPQSNLFDGSNFVTKLYTQFCDVIKNFDSARVLDYGCGKAMHLYKPVFPNGTLYQQFPGKIQTYYCYDPGNKQYQLPPSRNAMFDIVICADVMEHIPESMIERTLYDMRLALAPGGAILFTIGGSKAKKSFLDGENLHCSVLPMDYWMKTINRVFKGEAVYVRYEPGECNQIWTTPQYERLVKPL